MPEALAEARDEMEALLDEVGTEKALSAGQESPAYTVLKTRSGVGFAVFAAETTWSDIVPFIVGSQPCLSKLPNLNR